MSSFTPAVEYVADTVALVLYLEKRKSGATAEQIFDSAESEQTIIHIPAMVFAEILYLSEKKRITANLSDVSAHGLSSKFIYDEWNYEDYAKALSTVTEIPLDKIFVPPDKVNTWLFDKDNKIREIDFD